MIVPGGAPTVATFKQWAGIDSSDTLDDYLIQVSLDAAIAAQSRLLVWPCDENGMPFFDADVYEAALLRTLRLMARRSSPESIVGITGTGGDFVAARLPSADADITRLEGPHTKVVVA